MKRREEGLQDDHRVYKSDTVPMMWCVPLEGVVRTFTNVQPRCQRLVVFLIDPVNLDGPSFVPDM